MQSAVVEAAESRVRAQAERKARKLTLALASTVLIVALGGGGAWFEMERRAAESVTALTREVDDHLAQAAVLRGEADFAGAFAACENAEAAVAAAGVDNDLGDRVAQARAQINEAVATAATRAAEAQRLDDFLLDLEDVVLGKGLDINRNVVQRGRLASFESAFADYGLELFEGETDKVVERLRLIDRPVSVAQALDEYARVHRQFGWDSVEATRLTELARRLDPDPVRNRMRDAIAREDRVALRGLLDTDEAQTWPPATVAMFHLALKDKGIVLDVEPLLRSCQQRHPDDPVINQVLASRFLFGSEQDLEESLRFQAAALALRPSTALYWVRSGYAQAALGRTQEAVESFQQAIRRDPSARWVMGIGRDNLIKRMDKRHWLPATMQIMEYAHQIDPDNVNSLNNLGWFLIVRADSEGGDLNRGIALLELCVAADPDEPASLNSLGLAYLRAERWREALDLLQHSIEVQDQPNYADMLGVAIALWHLGQRQLARDWLAVADPQAPQPATDASLAWQLRDFIAMADVIRDG